MSEELTKEQATYAVEFARSLWDTTGQFGVFTPDLLHNLLLDLNINPLETNYKKIVEALNHAKDSAYELQGYSQWLEYNDMLYKRTLMYYANLLSFDLVITTDCPRSKMKTKEFKDDYKRVVKFFDMFDYKHEFANMLLEMLRKETVFTWLRTNTGTINDETLSISKNPKYTLQIMPQERCKLTGYFESGMLYEFDMNYFLQAGTSLEGYDPSFMSKYKEIFTDGGINDYYPQNPLSKRDGTFAYWVQTSPYDGAWVFKMDDSNFSSVPFLSPLLQNLIDNREISELQKNKDIASAYGLLVGELRMMEKQQTGQTKDAFSIDPKTLASFLKLIQKGMKSTIQVGAMPTENTDFYQFQDYNPKMSMVQNTTSSSLGASASRLIYSTEKSNQAELEASILNDYETVRKVYSQFNKFLEYYINRKTRKYKFKFTLDGCTQLFERESRQKGLQDLASLGLVLDTSAWASAYGYDPITFDRLLEQAKGRDISNKLTQLTSIHTAAGEYANNKGGRPLKSRVKTESREYDDSN